MSSDDALKQAEQAKQAGNASYKARDFDAAITSYNKAWSLHKSIVYLNNLAAAYFEKGDYDQAIETCQNAVEEGREVRADYKDIAKSFARIGSAYVKKEDFDNAVKFFNKSLTEHRTPDVLARLKEAEKARDEAVRQAYINPELGTQARDEGNALFKAGDFAGSIKLYTEAIKRSPEDARGYTNRSAAYTKLLALSEALKDAEQAIKVDPKFIKGYIRKSHVRFAMKEYEKALEAISEAREADTEHKHTKEIDQQERKCYEAQFGQQVNESDEERLQRAMRDPEVQSIISDPAMQAILQQAQTDPAALQNHMQNPAVRQKIMKLMSSGILQTRPR